MNNNDILRRVRYALSISDKDLIKIFKLGESTVSLEEVVKLTRKTKTSFDYDPTSSEEAMECTNYLLESFLNGLMIYKRGPLKSKTGEIMRPTRQLKEGISPNNVFLKKLKIALTLDSDAMIEIFKKADVEISSSQLSAFFRNEGHKHYRPCMDKYARSFLKGLTLTYRPQ